MIMHILKSCDCNIQVIVENLWNWKNDEACQFQYKYLYDFIYVLIHMYVLLLCLFYGYDQFFIDLRVNMDNLAVVKMPEYSLLVVVNRTVGNTWIICVDIEPKVLDRLAEFFVIY